MQKGIIIYEILLLFLILAIMAPVIVSSIKNQHIKIPLKKERSILDLR